MTNQATASPAENAPSIVPFAVMCVGMFVALLDIQIVASSLQDIGGGLSAAQDDISWVQTAADVLQRSEEHTSELQSPDHLVCRLLLEKKKIEMHEAGARCVQRVPRVE